MKYQEALYRLDDGEHTIEDFELLKKLAKEKDEQESRKDKLIVGSVWECVVEHRVIIGDDIHTIIAGSHIEVYLSKERTVIYRIKQSLYCTDLTEHFLLCFKPR